MNKIELFYWADQCPHNSKMKKLIATLGKEEACEVNIYDISNNYSLAKEYNVFSPTLTIVNDSVRLHGPIKIDRVKSILNGSIPTPSQYIVEKTTNIIRGSLKDITEATICDTCVPCAYTKDKAFCSDKSTWIKEVRDKYMLPHLGKLHYRNDECIGGAEFVPSEIVPYPIPRSKDVAFLTCSFLSSDTEDTKTHPLEKLEEELPALGFDSIIAIVAEKSCFPNGLLEWFLERGYMDIGEVYYEMLHDAKMHLVKKELR